MNKFIIATVCIERGQRDIIEIEIVDADDATDALLLTVGDDHITEAAMVAGDDDDYIMGDHNGATAAIYGEEWGVFAYGVPEGADQVVFTDGAAIEDVDQELITVDGFLAEYTDVDGFLAEYTGIDRACKFIERDNITYACIDIV